MKADILQILQEEATTQYNPNGKDERVVNSDEFDTVANQIVNLFKDKKYTEEDLRKAFKYGIEMEAGIESFDYKNYPYGFSQFINSLNKDYEK